MSIRERLDKELESVQQAFLTLCDKSIHQFELSFQAFIEKDMELAKRIIEEDVEMNKMEEEIHNKVVLLLTKQQPIVATDLRRLIVLLKICFRYGTGWRLCSEHIKGSHSHWGGTIYYVSRVNGRYVL